MRGAIAGAVVVLGAAVAAWWLWPNASAPVAEDGDGTVGRRIKEVTSSAAPTNAVPEPQREKTNAEKAKAIRDRYGDNIPKNLKATLYFLENPPQKTYHPARSKASIFKYRSERLIASYMNVEPGAYLVQRKTYDGRFDDDFVKSMSEPIAFSKDDTDEQRQMKQDVIDIKAELAERMKNGEKPSEIMNATIDNLYDLGRYRRDLEKQLAEFKRDAKYTDQDIVDFVTIANDMLKKKGAKGIAMPRLMFRKATLRMAEKHAAEKQKKEKTK